VLGGNFEKHFLDQELGDLDQGRGAEQLVAWKSKFGDDNIRNFQQVGWNLLIRISN
jgi:hypothetical protein